MSREPDLVSSANVGHSAGKIEILPATHRDDAIPYNIETGQFVMTGTVTGLHAPEPSHTANADFGLLGTVEMIFT
jgi:2-keto-4-pentenoate hydratase